MGAFHFSLKYLMEQDGVPTLTSSVCAVIGATFSNHTEQRAHERSGDEEHKIAAYADDVLYYISNPRITLPNLMKELIEYGNLSILKINSVKSEILNIGLGKKEELALQMEFPFTWGGKQI